MPSTISLGAVDAVLRSPCCRAALAGPAGGRIAPRQLACTACGTVFPQGEDFFFSLSTSPSAADRSLLIHQEDDLHASLAFQTFVRAKVVQVLRKSVSRVPAERVLDIGCGNGECASLLAGLYGSYRGLEPSPIPRHRRLPADPGGIGTPTKSPVTLVHYDPGEPLPVRASSVDLAMLLASYDHIPDPENVVPDVWRSLRSGGHLLIVMTNYGFWAKRLVNRLTGKRLFTHLHEHFRVHTPQTLEAEIRRFVPDARLVHVDADAIYLPNLPRALAWAYFSPSLLSGLNGCLRFFSTKILRRSQCGSMLAVTFQKP